MTRGRLPRSVLALFAVLFLASAPVALATNPPKLTGQITDLVDKLSLPDPSVTAALDSLAQGHGVTMSVLLDNTMPEAATTYAKTVANANNLGDHQALLVVTFADHHFSLWVGTGITNVSAADIDNILNGAVKEHLRNNDVPGAIVGAANGLGLVLAANPPGGTAPNSNPGGNAPVVTTSPAAPDFSGLLLILWSILLAVLALTLIFLVSLFVAADLRARDRAAALSARARALEQQAATAFTAADEALKSAGQDADFAEAEFGDAVAAPFHGTVTKLSANMHDLSMLQARVADSNFGARNPADPISAAPEGNLFARWFARRIDPAPAARITAYQQIIEEAEGITSAASAQAEGIRGLREAERTLAAETAKLSARQATVSADLAAAQNRSQALAARSPSAFKAVATNIDGAQRMLGLIEDDLKTARTAVNLAKASGPEVGAGALAIGRVAARLDKIGVLIGAIDSMTKEVETAAQTLPGHLTAAAAEIAKARVADTSDDVKGEEKILSQAADALKEAQGLAQSDPYASDAAAVKAANLADGVIKQVNDAVAARARREAAARDAYASAGRSLAEARSYIESHSSVVSGSARSRLEEADRQYQRYHDSMSTAEMIAAMAAMNAIVNNAGSAYSSAQADVSRHEEAEQEAQREAYSSHDYGSSSGGDWGGGGGMSSGGSW